MATKKKSAAKKSPTKKAAAKASPVKKVAAKKVAAKAAPKKSQRGRQRGRKTTVKCVSVPNELCTAVQAHADAAKPKASFSSVVTIALTTYMKGVPKPKRKR